MLDSIVDAFFPLLDFVEIEVKEVEGECGDPTDPTNKKDQVPVDEIRAISYSARNGNDDLPFTVIQTRRTKLRYAIRGLSIIHVPLWLAERLPRNMLEQQYETKIKTETSASLLDRVRYGRRSNDKTFETPDAFKTRMAMEQSSLLKRITQTRKIANGMHRLLVSKNDAVHGLRKRLVELRRPSMARTEVSIYMGDVHDHIIALLAHLQLNETHLGDLHNSYLAAIQIYNRRIRQHTDRKLINLATISVTILAMVFVTSLFSVNINRPGNEKGSGVFYWFGIAICLMALSVTGILVYRAYIFRASARRLEVRRLQR